MTAEQLEQIQAVAMDMWEPFAASTRAHLSDADDIQQWDQGAWCLAALVITLAAERDGAQARAARHLAERLAAPGSRMLDVGTGTGALAAAYAETFPNCA